MEFRSSCAPLFRDAKERASTHCWQIRVPPESSTGECYFCANRQGQIGSRIGAFAGTGSAGLQAGVQDGPTLIRLERFVYPQQTRRYHPGLKRRSTVLAHYNNSETALI